MNFRHGLALAGLALACAAASPAPAGNYAVVVSKPTFDDPAWQKVVKALKRKHQAAVIQYAGSVAGSRDDLAKAFPRYACFVATPEEAGRSFVVAVHRLTRALDADPYTDVFWGILTGYDAADALRIAAYEKPLLITRGAAGTSLDLDAFEQGMWFSEGERGAMFVKRPGAAGKQKCDDDATGQIVDMLNGFRPQLFLTSGHATTRDWQIGYSFRGGQLRCRDGQLYGLSLDRRELPVDSPEPKVYMPCGNCLIGGIPDRQCMALAWMHSGGVYQMFGYTVSTFFGYAGWGIRDYFIGQAGRYTLAEAFVANDLALVHELQTRFPGTAGANIDRFDLERDPTLVNRLAQEHGLKERDELGLLWDRDTVAFYGDPAWEARLAPRRNPAWRQSLTASNGEFRLELATLAGAGWGGRPVVQFLPRRVSSVKLIEGEALKPVIADNFILVPMKGAFETGQVYTIRFTAR